MIVADTNVVSEFMRDRPDSDVLTWASGLAEGEATICVVTVAEIERGLGRLAEGRRRVQLHQRWQQLVTAYAETIVSYAIDAARATATILVQAEQAGRTMSLADAQIAGCCLANNLALATRNTRDFASVTELEVINPFMSEAAGDKRYS